MNTGIIASRYAAALLKLVDETGSGDLVAAQVQMIEAALDSSPDFRHAVADPAVSAQSKLGLFEAAVATSLASELRKFIQLLIRNGRIGDARLVFTTFITEYYRSSHIKRARLVVADPSLLAPVAEPVEAPSLEARLREVIENQTGCKLLLKTEVDPALIGGFVFEVDDLLLDASVSRQIDIIKRQFIEKNRRIV